MLSLGEKNNKATLECRINKVRNALRHSYSH